MSRYLFVFAMLFSVCFPLLSFDTMYTSAKQRYDFHDNSEVRYRMFDLMYEHLSVVLAAPQTVYSQRDGNPPVMFQVRLNNEESQKVYFAFINQQRDERNHAVYPVAFRGNYLIRRDLEEDRIDQIKVFLSHNIGDQQSFIRFTKDPVTDASLAFIEIYGRVIYNNIRIPLKFETLIRMPFSELIDSTSSQILWDKLLSNNSMQEWSFVRNIPEKLRPFLPQLPEVYDGAMDAHGIFVRIETGDLLERPGVNCSGFVKWVADGVYRSTQQGTSNKLFLDINKLKKRQVLLRGQGNPWSSSMELQRDPYFGLDWARAIGQELMAIERGRKLHDGESDVRDIPYFTYLQDVGYPVQDLNTLMYLLAIKYPGNFYIGVINGNYGDPPLHQYYHEVAFFPYFDKYKGFQLVVMDTGVERPEGYIENVYDGEYIHFTRISAPAHFSPPPITNIAIAGREREAEQVPFYIPQGDSVYSSSPMK